MTEALILVDGLNPEEVSALNEILTYHATEYAKAIKYASTEQRRIIIDGTEIQ